MASAPKIHPEPVRRIDWAGDHPGVIGGPRARRRHHDVARLTDADTGEQLRFLRWIAADLGEYEMIDVPNGRVVLDGGGDIASKRHPFRLVLVEWRDGSFSHMEGVAPDLVVEG